MTSKSDIEDAFEHWLRQYPDIPEPTRELVFAPPQHFVALSISAWPEHLVAVEIDGL